MVYSYPHPQIFIEWEKKGMGAWGKSSLRSYNSLLWSTMVMSRCVGVRIWDWRGRQGWGCKVSCMPFGVMRMASPNDGELLRSGKAVSWHIMRFWCFDQGHPCKKVWPWEQRMLSLCFVYICRISKGNSTFYHWPKHHNYILFLANC